MSVPFVATLAVERAHQGDIYAIQTCTRYTVCASGDGIISLWDNTAPSDTLVPLNQQPIDSGIHHLAVDPAGRFVVAVSFDGTVVAFSLKTHEPLKLPETAKLLKGKGPWACAVNSEGTTAVATWKGSIFLVNVNTDEFICELKEPGADRVQPCWSVDISSDGAYVVGSYESGRTRVFDTVTRRVAYSMPCHILRPRCVRFSPSAAMIAVTGNESIALFTLNGGSYLGSLLGHESFVYALAFDPSGERLVSVAGDGKAKVWSLATRETLFTLKDAKTPLFACAWVPERTNVIASAAAGFVTGGVDRSLRWYREASGSNEF